MINSHFEKGLKRGPGEFGLQRGRGRGNIKLFMIKGGQFKKRGEGTNPLAHYDVILHHIYVYYNKID